MLAPNTNTQPNVVNGINVDDLHALIEGVRQDPAKGKTHWRVASAWQGQTRSRTYAEDFKIGGEQVARILRSTSTSPFSLAARTGSPIRKSICSRRLTPA